MPIALSPVGAHCRRAMTGAGGRCQPSWEMGTTRFSLFLTAKKTSSTSLSMDAPNASTAAVFRTSAPVQSLGISAQNLIDEQGLLVTNHLFVMVKELVVVVG